MQLTTDEQSASLDSPGALGHARDLVRSAAGDAGLSSERGAGAVLAAHEVTVNALTHGGGQGLMRVWRAGSELVCEVEDRGPGFSDRLAGRHPPDPGLTRGRGLWIARSLSDRIEIESAPGRTVVRLRWAL